MQCLIAAIEAKGLEAKTIRNLWATVRLIWDAALAQKYVNSLLPKPKLARLSKRKPRDFLLEDVAQIIAHSQGERRAFYWLAGESGLRTGELRALRLSDVDTDRLTVNQAAWHGPIEDSPKTDNGIRTIALSPELGAFLWEQIRRQRAKAHGQLFSTSSGRPWDAGLLVERKLQPLLLTLGIPYQ